MIPDDVRAAMEDGRARKIEGDDVFLVAVNMRPGRVVRVVWAEGTREPVAALATRPLIELAREVGARAVFAPGKAWGRFLPTFDSGWRTVAAEDDPGAMYEVA